MQWNGPRLRLAAGLIVVLSAAGCGIPRDPDDSLERVREEGVLHAGASHEPDLVELSADGDPTGPEADLVRAYAEHLGVDVEWTVGSESTLVMGLEEDELDIAVAGFVDDSPWADAVAFTRPYTELPDGPNGEKRAHVIAVPMGENAMLSDLERWLDEHGKDYS